MAFSIGQYACQLDSMPVYTTSCQSMEQYANQSDNLPINQTICQSISQSIRQYAISETICQLMRQACQSISRSANQNVKALVSFSGDMIDNKLDFFVKRFVVLPRDPYDQIALGCPNGDCPYTSPRRRRRRASISLRVSSLTPLAKTPSFVSTWNFVPCMLIVWFAS